MTDPAMQEVLEELFSSLQALETKTGAIFQFLKERSIVSDKDLAPFWEKAANESNVRWRATRIRMNHLLSTVSKANDSPQEKSPQATETKEDQQAIQQPSEGRSHSEEQEQSAQRTGEDSGTGPKDGDPRQKNEGDRGVGGNATDRPADEHAA